MNSMARNRIYALLLSLGALLLFYLTISMILFDKALVVLRFWVIALLFTESLIDLLCLIFSVRWFFANDLSRDTVPLRLGAAAAIIHALRVLVYVLGRMGPWINFDVKPEYHNSYTYDPVWMWLAAILASLGIAGVVIIWWWRRKRRKNN
jgi:hypothetical protein